jgi:methyl-accepting chemotaxis protein
LWSDVPRTVAFWAIVIFVVVACDLAIPPLDFGHVANVVSNATTLAGTPAGGLALESISKPEFAVSLAIGLGCFGLAFLVAFVLLHWMMVRLDLRRLRMLLASPADRGTFATAYDNGIYPRLVKHSLVGHAWKEFDETLLKGGRSVDGVIGNTVRPQAFINYGVLRERLGGLKMLGSISGWFVGVGLLLTFIGIVLALNKAGQSVSAENVKDMQAAMQELLHIASFKFSTSIAGLGVSIVFSIVAKLIVISLERGIAKFCDAAEHQMRYVAPQSLAVEMNLQSKDQLDQLKEINSDRYFSRLADSVSPLIEAAMARAISPVTEQIGSAIGKLTATSQDGVGDLIKQFSESVQGGAGTELKQLGATLQQMQETLAKTQGAMNDTGSDFTRRLSDAADNLNRLVSDAGSKLGAGAEASRIALQDVVESLRATFEQANSKIDNDLGNAASGAASKVEMAMGKVLERLETQVGGLTGAMQSFQQSSAEGVEATRQQIAQAQQDAAAVIASTGSKAAEVLQAGLAQALERISTEFERFEGAMRSGAAAYMQQAGAVGDATNQTRQTADAFSQVASTVRSSSAPLLQSSERIAQATEELSAATRNSLAEIERLLTGAGQLAEGLRQQSEQMAANWALHSERFEGADRSLAAAIAALGAATGDQSAALNKMVGDIDLELSKVLDRLRHSIGALGEHTEELTESVSMLVRIQQPAE